MTDEEVAKPWWRTPMGVPGQPGWATRNRVWHGYAVASFGFLLFGIITFIEPSRSLAGAMVGSAITAATMAVRFRKD